MFARRKKADENVQKLQMYRLYFDSWHLFQVDFIEALLAILTGVAFDEFLFLVFHDLLISVRTQTVYYLPHYTFFHNMQDLIWLIQTTSSPLVDATKQRASQVYCVLCLVNLKVDRLARVAWDLFLHMHVCTITF